MEHFCRSGYIKRNKVDFSKVLNAFLPRIKLFSHLLLKESRGGKQTNGLFRGAVSLERGVGGGEEMMLFHFEPGVLCESYRE